jgi:hypothetical protein
MLDQSTSGDQAIASHGWNKNLMLPAKEEVGVRSTQRRFAIEDYQVARWFQKKTENWPNHPLVQSC